MIKLYGNPLSTYCAKVRVVLRHKHIPFVEEAPPDGYGSPAYRAIVPMGTIPGFVDDEVVLSESEAIIEYLEERFPQAPLLPTSITARAHVRSLGRMHDCWIEPQLRALFPHVARANRDSDAIKKHVDQFWMRPGRFAEAGAFAPFCAGAEVSLADCAWPTTLIQAELLLPFLGFEFELPEQLAEWRSQLNACAAIEPSLEPYQSSMSAWLKQRGAA